MKCVICNTNSTYKERTANQGRCKKCKHPFAFEPKTNVGDTKDLLFKKAVDRVSHNNQVFYTKKQLFYAIEQPRFRQDSPNIKNIVPIYLFCFFPALFFLPALLANDIVFSIFSVFFTLFGILFLFLLILSLFNQAVMMYDRVVPGYRKKIKLLGIGLIIEFSVLGAIFSSVPWIGFIVYLMGIAAGLVLINLSFYVHPKIRRILIFFPSYKTGNIDLWTKLWIKKWTRVNEPLTKLISPLGENPSLEEDGTVNLLSADISAYSFDRLVVCDRPEIAQFLLANDFHREHNCAVLSVTGYPTRIFSPLLEMLRQNPNLKVYALHDASPRGVSLSHTLRTSPNWFPDPQIEMIDIGILPRQVFKNPKAIVQNLIRSNTPIEPIPAEVRQSLSHDEIVWLERGNYVDLESFPPYKLLQIVAQSLATNRELQPERESEREPVAFEIGGGFFAASEDFG